MCFSMLRCRLVTKGNVTVYARYEDVTAYDFLEAQIDLDYRRSWDTHAVQLRLIDSEPQTNSDVIYWETKWPVSTLLSRIQ